MLLQLFSGFLIFHIDLICHIQEGTCFQPLYQKGIVGGLCSCWNVSGWKRGVGNGFFLPLFICNSLRSPCFDSVAVPCRGRNMFLFVFFLGCYSLQIQAQEGSLGQVDVQRERNTALELFWQKWHRAASWLIIWQRISFRSYSFGSRGWIRIFFSQCYSIMQYLYTICTLRVVGHCNYYSQSMKRSFTSATKL